MRNNIHAFSQNNYNDSPEALALIGLRGKQAMDFAKLDLPILPGFIIDAGISSHLSDKDLSSVLQEYFADVEKNYR